LGFFYFLVGWVVLFFLFSWFCFLWVFFFFFGGFSGFSKVDAGGSILFADYVVFFLLSRRFQCRLTCGPSDRFPAGSGIISEFSSAMMFLLTFFFSGEMVYLRLSRVIAGGLTSNVFFFFFDRGPRSESSPSFFQCFLVALRAYQMVFRITRLFFLGKRTLLLCLRPFFLKGHYNSSVHAPLSPLMVRQLLPRRRGQSFAFVEELVHFSCLYLEDCMSCGLSLCVTSPP